MSATLAPLVFSSFGRYSVNAHESGVAYHKWRWSAGPWSGYYVLYVAHKWEGLDEGALGLARKVELAEAGMLVPTLDRYH